MPRTARFAPTGAIFHVANRRNDRLRLFFDDADYQVFLELMERAPLREKVKLFGLCIMPNHFHALIQPEFDGAMSEYMKWVQGCYACYFRSRTQTAGNGHVFQQRFWSDFINDDCHFINVLRYIEANPVSGKLVRSAQDWPWSSAAIRRRDDLLDSLPILLPRDWEEALNSDDEFSM